MRWKPVAPSLLGTNAAINGLRSQAYPYPACEGPLSSVPAIAWS
nr:hypothetical protein [Photorhabdus temperata]